MSHGDLGPCSTQQDTAPATTPKPQPQQPWQRLGANHALAPGPAPAILQACSTSWIQSAAAGRVQVATHSWSCACEAHQCMALERHACAWTCAHPHESCMREHTPAQQAGRSAYMRLRCCSLEQLCLLECTKHGTKTHLLPLGPVSSSRKMPTALNTPRKPPASPAALLPAATTAPQTHQTAPAAAASAAGRQRRHTRKPPRHRRRQPHVRSCRCRRCCCHCRCSLAAAAWWSGLQHHHYHNRSPCPAASCLPFLLLSQTQPQSAAVHTTEQSCTCHPNATTPDAWQRQEKTT